MPTLEASAAAGFGYHCAAMLPSKGGALKHYRIHDVGRLLGVIRMPMHTFPVVLAGSQANPHLLDLLRRQVIVAVLVAVHDHPQIAGQALQALHQFAHAVRPRSSSSISPLPEHPPEFINGPAKGGVCASRVLDVHLPHNFLRELNAAQPGHVAIPLGKPCPSVRRIAA